MAISAERTELIREVNWTNLGDQIPGIRSSFFHLGQTIYNAGDLASELLILTSGLVKTFSHEGRVGGKRRIVIQEILMPYAGLSEGVFLPDQLQPTSVQAMADCEALAIRISALPEILKTHPDLTLPLFNLFARRLREQREHADLVQFHSAEQKVALSLIYFDDRMEAPFNESAIANYTGITREWVSKIVGDAGKSNVVKTSPGPRGGVTITNIAALSYAADGLSFARAKKKADEARVNS